MQGKNYCVSAKCRHHTRVIGYRDDLKNHSDHLERGQQLEIDKLNSYLLRRLPDVQKYSQQINELEEETDQRINSLRIIFETYLSKLRAQLRGSIQEKVSRQYCILYLEHFNFDIFQSLPDTTIVSMIHETNNLDTSINQLQQLKKNIDSRLLYVNQVLGTLQSQNPQVISQAFKDFSHRKPHQHEEKEPVKIPKIEPQTMSNLNIMTEDSQIQSKFIGWQWNKTLQHQDLMINTNMIALERDDQLLHHVFVEPSFSMDESKQITISLQWDQKYATKYQYGYGQPYYYPYPYHFEHNYVGFTLTHVDINNITSYDWRKLQKQNPFNKGKGIYAAQLMNAYSHTEEKELSDYIPDKEMFSEGDKIQLSYCALKQKFVVQNTTQPNQKYEFKVQRELGPLKFGAIIFGPWRAIIIN